MKELGLRRPRRPSWRRRPDGPDGGGEAAVFVVVAVVVARQAFVRRARHAVAVVVVDASFQVDVAGGGSLAARQIDEEEVP